jgi:hypothetical protein
VEALVEVTITGMALVMVVAIMAFNTLQRKVQEFPIIGGSNQQLIPAFDSQASVNWYPLIDPVSGDSALYPYAGSKLVASPNVGLNNFKGRTRGAQNTEVQAFFTIGDIVFSMDTSFATTQIGAISTSVGEMCTTTGGDYLVLVDGASKWYYNIVTDSFLPIDDADAPVSPTNVCEQQGYFLFNEAGTQDDIESAQYNPNKFDELNRIFINYKSSALSYPLVCQESINGRIVSFTTGFIEIMSNQGKAGFTFRPDPNLIFSYGIPSQNAVAKGIGGSMGEDIPDFLIFVTNTVGLRKVMITYGQAPRVISSPSMEYKLNKLTNIADCASFVWTVNGQTFFQISFTTDNVTYAYNLNSKQWIDLTYNGKRHFAQSYVYFNGKHLVTSCYDSNIYELSEDYHTNDGVPITRERITQNIRVNGYKQFSVRLFWIWMQQGTPPAGIKDINNPNYLYGSQGIINVYISSDGGQTFGEPFPVSVGESAEFTHVTSLPAIGTYRDFCVKIVSKEPIPRLAILGSMMEYEIMEGTQ